MALTIYKQPQELTPAYNDQIITALSTGIANPDFKYIVQITVNGDTANTYTRDILQRPDGWLVFNAKEWVKNYIEHYFELDGVSLSSPLNLATNKTVSVAINISDFWSDTPQDSEAVAYEAFDACLTEDEFKDYDMDDYLFGKVSGKYFLSKTINSIIPDSRVTLNQPVFLHFINDPTNLLDEIIIELRRGGSTIDTVSIASFPTPVYTYDILQLYVGTQIFTTATPAVGDTVRVSFNKATVNQLRWSYIIQEIETDFTDYTMFYLSRQGNILPFHFEKLSTKNYTKKISEVSLNKNVLDTTTGSYSSPTYAREKHVTSTVRESFMTICTNWITEEQSTELLDLWDSPIRYIWDGTKLKSCSINNEPYEEKVEGLDPLFNYTITVDMGTIETRQRGI